MEGNLHKWTNYWNGWQQRFFVLKEGVLSYYNTQNESKTGGCKRSFKVSMFDIIVNKNDNTRVDLIIANDQHLYLKAVDYKERQKWLVAFATQKSLFPSANVSLTSNPSQDKNQMLPTLSENIQVDELNSSVSSSKRNAASATFELLNNYQNLTSYDATNLLKIKQSELRLYCDLLTQQTYDIKNLILGFNTHFNNDQNKKSQSIDNFNESNKTDSLLDTLPINYSSSNKLKSNDNLSQLSFKSAESTTLADKRNNGVDTNNHSEDENLNSSLNENTDPNLENIKKMDDITSNINITCDMLIQIIRNLIILSNTSSNISSAAVNSLLNSVPPPSISSNSSSADTAIVTDIRSKTTLMDQINSINLNNPLYTNSQLNHYRLRNKSSTSYDTISINESQINNSASIDLTNGSRQNGTTTHQSSSGNITIFRDVINLMSTEALKDTSSSCNFHFINNENRKKVSLHQKIFIQGKRTGDLPNIHDFKQKSAKKRNIDYFKSSSHLISNNSRYQLETFKEEINLKDIKTHDAANENRKDLVDSISVSSGTLLEERSCTEKMITDVESFSESINNATITITNYTATELTYSTFFTVINHRFIDLKLTENNEVPTEFFLDCCSDLLSLIDNFGSSAFVPVKIDVHGNIQKLRQKYSKNPTKYHTLQSIVQDEVNEKVTNVKNSATDALMWLRRGIWFMQEFLVEFSNKFENDMTGCVYNAYDRSLKQYHNWVVKSIFSLATRALPTKDDFLKGIAASSIDFQSNRAVFEKQVIEDMRSTAKAVDLVLANIKEFYIKNNLEH